MRIAVIADIHGNAPALEAVLDDLARLAPDRVVNLGDCLSGPLWPEETAQMLMARDWITVRGNHDRVVAAGNVPPGNRSDAFTRAALSDQSLDWLQRLPATARLDGDILACHATPDDDNRYLSEEVEGRDARLSDEAEIMERLGGETAGTILFGHTHIPRVLRMPATGQLLINPGSVGFPAYDDGTPHPHRMQTGSPHARYALIERGPSGWRVDLKAIDYDWAAAGAQARRNSRPDWAEALETGFCRTVPA
jgi:predicted phosphodiesterase